MKQIECVVDRIEDGIAVLICSDNGAVIEVDMSRFGDLKENMSCVVYCEGDVISEIKEKEASQNNKKRLSELFKRKEHR